MCANPQPHRDAAGPRRGQSVGIRIFGEARAGLSWALRIPSRANPHEHSAPGCWCGVTRAGSPELTKWWSLAVLPVGPQNLTTVQDKPHLLLGFADCCHHVLAPVWIPAFPKDELTLASFRPSWGTPPTPVVQPSGTGSGATTSVGPSLQYKESQSMADWLSAP